MFQVPDAPQRHSGSPLQEWLAAVHGEFEAGLREVLKLPDERGLDPRWTEASATVREFVLRPGKRLRPALVVLGYALTHPGQRVPDSVWRFAAGLELLHTFLLIHDDIADRAELRRGGRALHQLLGPDRLGEDLAVVAGDHLFARSIEAMLESGAPHAAQVVTWFLQVCRHTAAGQYLDLELARAPLSEVTLFQTLKVAHLKTARYGFVAPLVCGARIGGAAPELVESLERIGRHAGLAFQLRDDLIGLFGDADVSGKSADSDLEQGKRTFPVIAAWLRADTEGRAVLEATFARSGGGRCDEAQIATARALIRRFGGDLATERAIDRGTRAALRALEQLPEVPATAALHALIHKLAHRAA